MRINFRKNSRRAAEMCENLKERRCAKINPHENFKKYEKVYKKFILTKDLECFKNKLGARKVVRTKIYTKNT